MIARKEVNVEGIAKEMAIETAGYVFLLPNDPMADWFLGLELSNEDVLGLAWRMYAFVLEALVTRRVGRPRDAFDRKLLREVGSSQRRSLESLLASARKAVEASSWQIFSRRLWTRSEVGEEALSVSAYVGTS